MTRVGPLAPRLVTLTPARSLSDLLWVANTRHGPGGHWFARVTIDSGDHDHLGEPAPAAQYLTDHRVVLPSEQPSPRHLRLLIVVRDMVRGLVDPSGGWTPAALEILDNARFRTDVDGNLVAVGSGWDAFIDELMVPLLQVVEVRDRLRMCANPSCRLMFVDLSRNRARRWCDTAGCGNRDRVRRYRIRAKASELAKPAITQAQ